MIQHFSVKVDSSVIEIIGDHQRGFRRNRFTTDQIFHIHQILETNESTLRQSIKYLYTSRKPMTQLIENSRIL